METKIYVTYEQFGAVGDGVADDFLPIYKAHNYANEHKLPVKTPGNKIYRINHTFVGEGDDVRVETINIMTDVDWGNSEIYIDDSDLNPFDSFYRGMHTKHVFVVKSQYDMLKIEDPDALMKIAAGGVGPGTKRIDLGFERDYPVMIIPYSSSHKVYRRLGFPTADGKAKTEVIVLDKDGFVSEETPLMFEYPDFDYINVYRIDDAPITLKGGIFTTLACKHNAFPTENNPNKHKFGYFSRGMNVARSNVTVDGVKHYMRGETTPAEHRQGKRGPHYGGFYAPSHANHVTFKNCVLTARRNYNLSGTYEINVDYMNKIVFENCVQSNFWVTLNEDGTVITPCDANTPGAAPSMCYFDNNGERVRLFWGCGGCNFSKNVEYIGSTISRFDAHEGLYNGKIINSTVNAVGIIGGGKMIIENSRWYAPEPSHWDNHIVGLRDDYGSTWRGTIEIRNVDAYFYTDITSTVLCCNYYNWHNGYTNYQPALTIDGLKLYDIVTKEPLGEGFEIQASGHNNPNGQITKAHIDVSHTPALFGTTDSNGNGFVDDPHNCNKDLVIDGKAISVEYVRGEMQKSDSRRNYNSYCDENCYRNVNKKVPPEYIKVLNNDAGYKFLIEKTAGKGVPNGAYHGVDEDGDGGYFGCTKFYYTEDKYLLGTDKDTSKIDNCPFVFE